MDKYDVRKTQVHPQQLLVAKASIHAADMPASILACIGEVWGAARAAGIKPGRNVALYWNDASNSLINTANGLPTEAGAEIDADIAQTFVPTATVQISATPGGWAATARHTGDYGGIPAAHAAVRAWCSANNLAIAGPNWEVYGHWEADTAKLTTDVFYLLS